MISINLDGRHGNHLWKYAVCRTVAEHNGYEFHIPRNWLGKDLFDCSLGIEQETPKQIFIDHPSQVYNPDIFKIPDFTRIQGFVQAEHYIINNKKNVQSWFTQRTKNTALFDQVGLGNRTCVINFRGEDYKNMSDVYIEGKFYHDSIRHIKSFDPNVNFVVVCNDVEEARKFFPDYPIYHFGVNDDYYLINQAEYLIIANSTFSWWAAWLNDRCKMVIAPKYWFRHNVSNGWWSNASSITTGFFYVDRAGELFTSNQCLKESPPFDPQQYPF